jgi:hypothetical protein
MKKSIDSIRNEIERLKVQARNCPYGDIEKIRSYSKALEWLFDDNPHLITQDCPNTGDINLKGM